MHTNAYRSNRPAGSLKIIQMTTTRTRTAESVESQSDDDTPISQKTPAEVLVSIFMIRYLNSTGVVRAIEGPAAPC